MTPVSPKLDRRICVAPMMDYTDRHFRFLLRLLSPHALLYTEMVNAEAIVRGDADRLLAFHAAERPLALQLGGNDPQVLARAARIASGFGYDEINLNCGCPSDRVQSGRFGACLMAEPERVRDCVLAMREVVEVPVTVKCRIAIEPGAGEDEYAFLRTFVSTVEKAGCTTFILHARKAVLSGLSPKQNREIPPLRFDLAEQLRKEFPMITLIVNGGVRSLERVTELLTRFDGVMIGREICDNPYRLAELERHVHSPAWRPVRGDVVRAYYAYMLARCAEGHRPAAMLRHALGLFAGQPRARSWRRFISERAGLPETTPDLLLAALPIVMDSNESAAA